MNRSIRPREVILLMVATAVVFGLVPHVMHGGTEVRRWVYRTRDLQDCKSNLKNIGTAAEMYSTDNSGRYATSLKQLVPGYLPTIPTCPAATTDTYSPAFTSASNPDAYTVVCVGDVHRYAGVPINWPQYHSWPGCLLEK